MKSSKLTLRLLTGLSTVVASLWLGAGDARADGISVGPQKLAAPVRTALVQEIAQHRAQNPAVYDAVRNVQGIRPDVYMKFRAQVPIADRELRGLGKEALLPMLEALAFDAPARGGLNDTEWQALETGLLRAVGILRDAKAAPVVRAIFTEQTVESRVSIEAAEALGRICDKESFDFLVASAQPGQPLRASAVQGLGECRTYDSAKVLASLAKKASAAEIETFAAALGSVGSSWAWEAMGPAYESESDAARQLIVGALMDVFVKHEASRGAIQRAIVMADHPNTLGHIQQRRSGASATLAKALDDLEARYKLVQSRK